MGTGVQELKHAAKVQEWSARVAECRSSGIGVKAWCREHGIALKTYYNWERKIVKEAIQQYALPAPTQGDMLILTSAVEDGLITKNPAKDRRLKNPAIDKGGTKALTKAQIASIQSSIPLLTEPRERLVMALLAYTSMRREELLGLRWENVDMENRLIHVCQAVTYPKSKPVVKGTKTDSSVRNIPIADALYEVLEPLAQASGYVLPGRGGKPVSEPTFRRLWKSIGEHIELYGETPINFRTTFATMAVASGVDIRTTQSLMGHSTPEMTLSVYTRQEDTRLPEAMKQMSGFLHGDKTVKDPATRPVS